MRVIVTRPAADAARWCEALAARGFDALALPLIEIAPVSTDAARAALADAWRRITTFQALMFVSSNAAIAFFAARPADARVPWNTEHAPRCWAPGPGTAAALVDAGVPAPAILSPAGDATQFDSEALWAVVGAQVAAHGAGVLLVRGADGNGQGAGRDWLAQQLAARGVPLAWVEAYERRAPRWNAAQRALAAAAAVDGSVWLFSSSEAITHLQQAAVASDWSRARAVVTHPRIGETARAAGFGVVSMSRPTVDDVARSIESGP